MIRLVVTLLVFIFASCNSSSSSKGGDPGKSTTLYNGYVEGCKEHWDELICGKRTINADSNESIKRDENGTPVVIGKEDSKDE